MSDERDQVRSRVSLVELVGQRVVLKRAGKDWKGLCPFHNDRNPSFQVSDVTGSYRCWSCGARGDIFNWVMETQRVEFREALRILAEIAGIELTSGPSPVDRSRATVYETAMQTALQFFREQLSATPPALNYCDRRGLDAATRDAWELGFGPAQGEALATALKRAGVALADAKELFLVDGDAGSGYHDRFRGRLIFPIRDARGRLVAFGGRLLGDGQPKYINSSDTPLYSKRKVLYGMNRAQDAIAARRRAVLVEGYLDVIACHRAGVIEAVASLGTSLSEDHAQTLRRWSDEVVVLYDADAAGLKAADRAADLLLAEGVRVRVAQLPPGDDPDTLLRTVGPDAVVKAAANGLTPLDFRMAQLRTRNSVSDEAFWTEAVALLALAPSPLEAERHILELAGQYPGLRDPMAAAVAIRRLISAARIPGPESGGGAVARRRPRQLRGAVSEMNGPEQAVFEALFDPELIASAWTAIQEPELFVSGVAYEMSVALTESFPRGAPSGTAAAWLSQVEPAAIRDRMNDLAFRPRFLTNPEVLKESIARLHAQREGRSLRDLKPEAADDDAKLRDLDQRLRKLRPDTRVSPAPKDRLL